jgi:hypothetical protein
LRVTAQELLEAFKKAQNDTSLDQVAVWALSKYLQDAWKNSPGRNLRAYDLGQVLSDFFVDLSLHRLPEKITKQLPQTEQYLLEFYGVTEGGLSQFWMRCIEIWNVTLEPYPAYAKEVKRYFDLLLQASPQGKRTSVAAPIKPTVESSEKPAQVPGPVATISGTDPETPASTEPLAVEPLVEFPELISPESSFESSAAVAAEPSFEPPEWVAAEHGKDPELADIPIPAGNEADSATPEWVTAEPDKEPELAEIPVPAGSESDSATPAQAPILQSESEPKSMPKHAYLVLQGTRVIPLDRPLIKIGRQLDNHIILEDPRVSRSHAQIELINERFVIFDMNSTGGTFVNGKSTNQSVLYTGDVVSLAGVVFIFSQEMPARPGDMKIFELGSPYAADRPTAIIHMDEIRPPKKFGPKDLPDLPKTGPLK